MSSDGAPFAARAPHRDAGLLHVPDATPSHLHAPAPPDGIRRSTDFKLAVDGRDVFVHGTDFCSFAALELEGEAEAVVEVAFDFSRCVVRPLSRAVEPRVEGRRVSFGLPSPTAGRSVHLSVEFHDADGKLLLRRPLFVLASPPIAEPTGPNVRTFEPGRVHDVGELVIEPGQTIHVPAGAVVRGRLRATGADDIAIVGGGILDGSRLPRAIDDPARRRFVLLADCRRVRIEGVTLLDSPSWCLVPVGCDDVLIREVKVVNHYRNDDGIDLVGCRDVHVDRCFVRAKDDCVAIKATDKGAENPDEPETAGGLRDVERIRVTGGTFWNADWGNALEIGYETRCGTIRDVTFEDCDVIRSEPERWTSGGVLTIHNGDRAHVRDITYRNLRVEEAGTKLLDFKVCFDKYSRDETRGEVSDILIDGLHVVDGPLAPSILQGTGVGGADRVIRNVTIRDLTFRGEPIRDQMAARLIAERVADLKFE